MITPTTKMTIHTTKSLTPLLRQRWRILTGTTACLMLMFLAPPVVASGLESQSLLRECEEQLQESLTAALSTTVPREGRRLWNVSFGGGVNRTRRAHYRKSSSEEVNGFRPCDNCVCQASGKRRWECKKWHLSTGGKCRVTPCIGCQQRLQARTVFNPFPYYGHRRLSVPKEAAPEREPTEPQQGSDLTITTTTPPLVIDSASPSSEEQSQEGSLSEESQEGNLSEPGIRRRRLVEAAYFAFIGFNMLLMCCLLVGISFAYHVGTREANYAPIRW